MSDPTSTPSGMSEPGNPPSAQDWENYKAIISDLYRRYKLRDVRSFMIKNHQFLASERMYRTRIKSWRLDKKLKDREARAIVRIFRQRRAHDGGIPTFRLRGKDISVADALHSLKRKGVSEDDLDDDPDDDTSSQTPSDLSVVSEISRNRLDVKAMLSPNRHSLLAFHCEQTLRPPSTPPDLWHSQYLVSQISNYCLQFSSSIEIQVSIPYENDIMTPRKVFNLFYWGSGLVYRHDSSGWSLMERSLKLTKSVIELNNHSLLPLLLDLYQRSVDFGPSDPRLTRMIEFTELLKGWSESLLGVCHPITLICYTIIARGFCATSLLHSNKIIAANLEIYQGKDDRLTKSAKIQVCRTLSSLELFTESRYAWESLIYEFESLHDEDDLWVRACLFGMACDSLACGDLTSTNKAILDIAMRTRKALSLQGPELLQESKASEWCLEQIMTCVRRSQIRIGQAQALLQLARNLIFSGAHLNRDFAVAFSGLGGCFNKLGEFDAARGMKLYYEPVIEQTQLDFI